MKVIKILKENESFYKHDIHKAICIINIDKIYFLENDFLHNIYGPAEINMLNLQKTYYYRGFKEFNLLTNKRWKKIAKNYKRDEELKIFI